VELKREPGSHVTEMFVIYDSPRDFPCLFVAQRWEVDFLGERPTADFAIALTLEAIRDELPPGLARLPRCTDDEPHIVEVWL
jgi:hypothetical protein